MGLSSILPVSNLFEEITNPPNPSAEVKNVDVIRALSDAFVSVSQNVSQGVLTNQIVAINCDRKNAGDACLMCMKTLKSVGFDDEYISKNCEVSCTCNIENVKLSQIITLDLSSKLDSVTDESFFKQFQNSIVSQTYQSESAFNIMSSSEITSLTASVSNAFTKMKSVDFKQKVDQINNLQFMTLKGAGQLRNITVQTAVNFVARCIMASENIMSDVTEMQKQVISMTSQITRNYMLAMVELIVNIIFFVIFVFFAWTIIQLMISLITQYSSARSLVENADSSQKK